MSTLKCITLRFENTPDITETPLGWMIISGTRMSIMTHVHSWRTFVVEPQTSISYSLCFCDTCNIRDLIIGIFIHSSISLPTLPFIRSVIFNSRDLVTCCNIGWISASGPRVSFRHVEEQILLLVHTPQPTPLEYPKTPFQSPCYRVTVDAIKAATGCSDYNVTSQSKD
jgi:hypothetical protein